MKENIFLELTNDSNINEKNDEINLTELIQQQKYNWKWYLISVLIFVFFAIFYLRYSQNVYLASSTIFINDEESGGLLSEMSAFDDINLISGKKTLIINEMGVLKSRTLMEKAVEETKSYISYFNDGRIKNHELFIDNLPLNINLFLKDSLSKNLSEEILITPNSNTTYNLQLNENEIKIESLFGENIDLNFGVINVTPKISRDSILGINGILIKISSLIEVSELYREKLEISEEAPGSNLLILNIEDPIKEKAISILDNLVDQYNQGAINDRSKIAEITNDFINDRIDKISINLANVDLNIEKFKRKNQLVNIESDAELMLASNSELEKRIVELNSQIRLVEYLQEYINSHEDDLIPMNIGLEDESTGKSTMMYNNLLMERNRILKGSSRLNPTVINLDSQIKKLKQSIKQSLQNFKSSLDFSLNAVSTQELALKSKISSAPKQEREIRDITRQQQIIETLYLYLLEKREENAISLAGKTINAKIIDSAYSFDDPIAPKKILILIISIIMGLLIPFIFYLLKGIFNNKIISSEDVDKIIKNASILGDIPSTKGLENRKIINYTDRDSYAEAFRIIRTKLDFVLPQKDFIDKGKIIFITSTIAGEGKTNISINLSSVISALDKKVILIGADLRKPKLSKYLDLKKTNGLTHYLANPDIKIEDVIISSKENYPMDIINSWEIPPNPTDLLNNDRFNQLINYCKENYDYVIVDTPPFGLVADTLMINKYSDLLIYVIRANFLDKRLLNTVNKMYSDKKLKNLAFIINDTSFKKKGYGYKYGY